MYELNILPQIFNIRTYYFLEYFIFKFLMCIGIASTNVIVNSRSFDDFSQRKFKVFLNLLLPCEQLVSATLNERETTARNHSYLSIDFRPAPWTNKLNLNW